MVSRTAADHAWLADLAGAAAYPDTGGRGTVERIDTHISHVFLTATRAHKVKRPVRLSFLDFSTAEARLADNLREVALNRRLAPDVYLGIAPILLEDGKVRVGPVAETVPDDPRTVETCVVMRRLRAGTDLKSMIERGAAKAAHIDRVAEVLAAFHAAHGLGRPSPSAADGSTDAATAPARANFAALAEAPAAIADPAQVASARRLAAELVEARRADFEKRREEGRIVDGHGDLHAEHVWFENDAEPLMIDCLEFRDDFRRIDAASDAAFLAMDLTYRGRADLAARFLRRYARASGDYGLFAVVDFYLSYRALVRAKVAALVAADESMSAERRAHAVASVKDHLALGLGYLTPRAPGPVLLCCGTIGTGKTTVAEAIADASGGVVISSDRLRGSATAPDGNTAYGGGRYDSAARAAVYRRMLDAAAPVVRSGRPAILDATFSKREWRDEAARWAREHAGGAALVEVVAARDDVIARLAARAAAGNDASEAGPGLYDAMRAEFEEPAEWPAETRTRIDTSAPDWTEFATAVAARLGT